MAEPAERLSVVREYGETIDIGLLAMADDVKHDKYDRDITEEERIAFGESVIKLSEHIENVQEEKKAQTKMYNDDIKESTVNRREILKTLRRGKVEQADKLHLFYEDETATVHTYNSLGERTGVRRMNSEERERQLKIKERN